MLLEGGFKIIDKNILIYKYKGQITIFAFLIIGIVIGMYLMGYTSPFLMGIDSLLKGNPQDLFNNLINSFKDMIISPSGLGMIGIALAGIIIASAISGGSGFLFGISILIVIVFANYFVLPTAYIYESGNWGEAEILKTILVLVLNALMMVGLISFVRSGET